MLISARGARAVEAALFQELERLLSEGEADPTLLALPIRVVVPSRSLRQHLAASLIRRRGRSAAGILFQTLFGVASEVLERRGLELVTSRALFELLVRRLAPAEPLLAEELGHLDDGYAVLAGTLRDLLDAGFAPAAARTVARRLAAAGRGDATRGRSLERALALVRLGSAVGRGMAAQDRVVGAGLFAAAAEALALAAPSLLPARAILVHGFADATGAATRLIGALVECSRAQVFLDRPPDPADPARDDPGVAFSARFVGELCRLTGAATPATGETPAPARLQLVQAPGPHAEVREVGERIRRLLASGALPEGIGVVARELGPYRLAFRQQFERMAIPFSGLGASGPAGAAGRHAAALADLLERRGAVPAERWLDARARGRTADLRLALGSLGVARLEDVAELDPDPLLDPRGDFPLPLRQGLRGHEDESGAIRAVADRRRLPGSRLRECVEEARSLLKRFAGWPRRAPATTHASGLRRLLGEDLRWHREHPGQQEVLELVADLEAELPDGLAIAGSEWLSLLAPALRDLGQTPIGGAGGGVAVLGVIEARARTFDHLFVIGLNRDAFPRLVREDPLLPDSLRALIAESLPALPLKREPGFNEEHYLFAQLVSSAPAVTLLWSWSDDDGKPLTTSPLVERVRLAGQAGEVASAPHPLSLPPVGSEERGATAAEHAIRSALGGPREQFKEIFPLALAEGLGRDPGSPASGRLAAARLALLDELDPDLRTPDGRARRAQLGPWFGFVGALGEGSGTADPRRQPLWVTALERMGRCPWQYFLSGLLRLEQLPDPLAELPAIGPLEVGNLCHAVLHQVVLDALPDPPRTLEQALTRSPTPVPWPAAARLEQILREQAPRILRDAGIGWQGLAGVLVERARTRLEVAREIDWPEPGDTVPVIGVEVEGEIQLALADGGSRSIRFRADRVDRRGEIIRLVDYKSSKSFSDAKGEDTRHKHFLKDVRGGKRLQAVVYASVGAGAEGRLQFLAPDREELERVFTVGAGDREIGEAFAGASRVLLSASDLGTFLPLFQEPASGGNEDHRCAGCEVQIACLRGDSGARRRLSGYLEALRARSAAGPELDPTAASVLALGSLHD